MFNGGSCIALNGQTIARTRQFSLEEVVILSQYVSFGYFLNHFLRWFIL